jgi:hypothetical protein
MRTLLASVLALGAFTSAAFAEPLVLSAVQMDTVTAGQISQSNTSEVNVTQSNTSNVSMTADASVNQSTFTSTATQTDSHHQTDSHQFLGVSVTMSLTKPGQSTLSYTAIQTD